MKKLFILMFVMILLIGTVSALDIDDVKDYNKENKTYTLKNALGLPLIGKTIAELELKTPQNNLVPIGYQKVAEIEIRNKNFDYENIINGIELYNIKKDMEGFSRNVDYKVKTIIQVPKYKMVCSGKLTEIVCNEEQDGLKNKIIWTDFTRNSLNKNEIITLGIFTDVQKGDNIEWVINVYGNERLTAWAEWTESLNVNIENFYKFNETSGDTIDFVNGFNGTIVGTITQGVVGLINNSYLYVSGTDYVNIPPSSGDNLGDEVDDFSVSIWFNLSSGHAGNIGLFQFGNLSGDIGDFNLALITGQLSAFGSNIVAFSDTGSFHHYVSTFDGTTFRSYLDGTSVENRSFTSSLNFTGENFSIGTYFDTSSGLEWEGLIDELGIWSRTLSQAEVTQLFNGGAGITFIDFPPVPPTINLDSPTNNTNFTTNNVVMNATIFDALNITNVTLYLDDIVNETNLTAGLNNTVWTFTKTMGEGDAFWTIESCNFNNSCGNASQRIFNVNTTPDIQYGAGVPVNNFNSTINFFDVNVTITEDLFQNITFDLYNTNSDLNETVTFTNSSRNVNWSNLPDGNYSYNVTIATTTNLFNFTETRNISIDTIDPLITVTSPTGDQGTFSSGLNLSLAWVASDVNIDVCQFDYEGSNTTVNCDNTEIGLTVTDSTATNLTFYVNDTFGRISFNSTSWSYSFIENNITFTPDVFETSSHFFEINLSTSLSVSAISAELNYNGTNFISSAACGEFCLVNNTIDIPLVTEGEFENKSFFWEISIFNGTDSINVNTSSTEQNVTRIHLEECGGAFTIEALNFTAHDEQNLSRIDPYLFDGDFDQWLGEGTVKRQSNFSASSTSDVDLCISPEDETFFIDATIEYDEAGNESLYTLRNYYFQNDTINNVSEDIFMYLLQSEFSTSFILKVQDDALLPVGNVLIETNRFYPGLNEFRIVQIAKTDALNGKSVGFFETEIVDYKFIITFNNNTLLETGVQKVIPETSPFTLTFNLGENLGQPWFSQIPLDNLISTLVWNDTSGIITYTYADSSTILNLARLFVIQQSLVNSSADSTICNVNSSLNAAVLTCDVGNSSGFYTASSFITRNSTETLDLQISFQIETLSAIVGLLGLFYGWFLILIASFMFKFNEIAGIWAITIVVLMVNLIGLINFGGVFVTATIGVAILLTWLMSN